MDQIPKSVFFWSILLLVVVAVSVGTFYFDNSRSILENQYLETFEASVTQLDASVYEFLTTFENAVQMFSQNDMVKSLPEHADENLMQVEQMFKTFKESYPYSAYAYYVFKNPLEDGRFMVTWPDTSETLRASDYDPLSRPWYIGAIEKKGFISWSDPYKDATTGKPTITVSRTVYNDGGMLEGVMAIDVFLDELSNKVENFTATHSGNAFIVKKSGNDYILIAHNEKAADYSSVLMKAWIKELDERQAGTREVEFGGESYYLTYTTNEITGWKTVGLVEKHAVYVQSMRVLRNVLVSTMVILSLGALTVGYISRQLTDSVKDIGHLIRYSDDKPGTSAMIELTEKLDDVSFQINEDEMELPRTALNITFDTETEMARIRDILKLMRDGKESKEDVALLDVSKCRLENLKKELYENASWRANIQIDEVNALLRSMDEENSI